MGPEGTAALAKVLAKGLVLGVKDYDEGPLDSDDLLGKVKVGLDALADHSTVHFKEAIKPQGVLVFSVSWEDLENAA